MTDVGCIKRSKMKCIAVLMELCTDLARFMKTVHVVRLVGRLQRSEVGFSHYLTLNWISVNKLRLRLS